MEVPFETFADFLNWLFGPSIGGFSILIWFVSWALEDFQAWHDLPSKIRSLVFYIGSILIGVGAYLLSQNEQVVLAIEPYFKIVLSATVVWLSSQVAHKADKSIIIIEDIEEEEPSG